MAKLMNAKIFLADVDPLTGQMTPKTLLECIKNNKLKKIKAIVTMYLGGYPENVIEFYNIKKRFNCYLIEDACHAFGARYKFENKKLSKNPSFRNV
jgi:dTDP-4-amino-4,6-dideoxygalactose transaminase